MADKTVICPETGKVLSRFGSQIKKHILNIWGVDVDKNWSLDNEDAKERISFLLEAIIEEGK